MYKPESKQMQEFEIYLADCIWMDSVEGKRASDTTYLYTMEDIRDYSTFLENKNAECIKKFYSWMDDNGLNHLVVDSSNIPMDVIINTLTLFNISTIYFSCTSNSVAKDIAVLIDNGWQLEGYTKIEGYVVSKNNHILLKFRKIN